MSTTEDTRKGSGRSMGKFLKEDRAKSPAAPKDGPGLGMRYMRSSTSMVFYLDIRLFVLYSQRIPKRVPIKENAGIGKGVVSQMSPG